jgi:hypothetical protein
VMGVAAAGHGRRRLHLRGQTDERSQDLGFRCL